MLATLLKWRNTPSELVGPNEAPLIRRWFLLPKNRWLGIYLHHIQRSDEDRALHDHPKPNISILLRGSYREWMFLADVPRSLRQKQSPDAPWKAISVDMQGHLIVAVTRRRWQIVARRATVAHRIELIDDKPVWTLFITGPKQRQWGFHCAGGWIPHFLFHDRGGCN